MSFPQGRFCVAQPHGRAHFTDDLAAAFRAADQVRSLLRSNGLAAGRVRVQRREGKRWRDVESPGAPPCPG